MRTDIEASPIEGLKRVSTKGSGLRLVSSRLLKGRGGWLEGRHPLDEAKGVLSVDELLVGGQLVGQLVAGRRV